MYRRLTGLKVARNYRERNESIIQAQHSVWDQGTELYWYKDAALGVPYVQKIMPRDRFDKLTQYLHIDNEKAAPRGHRNHDKLFKVCPLFEVVNRKFLEEYQPSQNLTLDEAIISFKGQLLLIISNETISSIETCEKGNDSYSSRCC